MSVVTLLTFVTERMACRSSSYSILSDCIIWQEQKCQLPTSTGQHENSIHSGYLRSYQQRMTLEKLFKSLVAFEFISTPF